MLIRQIIVTFYLLLFLSVGAGLAEAEQRLRDQEHVLQRLRTDPAYVEMKIRQRLGYARPEEFIFRFDE
jgi:cell division protein FtsB